MAPAAPPGPPGGWRGDAPALASALAAFVGARLAWGAPLWSIALATLLAAVLRSVTALAAAVLLAASLLASWAWAGLLEVEERPGAFEGRVVLVSDPRDALGGIRVDARLPTGRRCEARASGGAASALRSAEAGEGVSIRGRVVPAGGMHLWVRHVSCRLRVAEVGQFDPGSVATRAAGWLRGVLLDGASVLPRDLRSLYGGFVLGDVRGQDESMAEDFRAAGMTHLLVVSGQNVVLVLAFAGPVLRRLSRWPRLATTAGLLAFFALVTRFEPSVLRATAMAAIASAAAAAGRPAGGRRTLAAAVCALVLVDPLLVHSLGFGLSVGASAAILLLARPLADALPLPRSLAEPSSVVVAAQAGVSPILVLAFDGVPLASLPANLLAGPVSGFVVVWGLAAGLVAGLAGDQIALALHQPTRFALAWVASVARAGAAAPLGELGAWQVVGSAAAAAFGVLARRRGMRRAATIGGLVAIGFACSPAVLAGGGDAEGAV